MQRTRALIAITSAALLVTGLGTATARADTPVTDLYVNAATAACTDAGTGTQAAPYCSIQAAADAALPGQTVVFQNPAEARNGKAIVLTHSGEPGKPITIAGGAVGVRSPGSKLAPTAGNVAITVAGAHDITLVGLTLYSTGADALDIKASDDITVDASTISSNAGPTGNGISIDGASQTVSVTRTQVGATNGLGVDVQSGAAAVTLADDWFTYLSNHGLSQLGGVHADGVTGIRLAGNTFALFCGTAVSITGASSGSIENTVLQNPAVAIGTYGACTATGPTTGIAVSGESAAGIHADYNLVHEQGEPGSTDYLWAGTPYPSSASFNAATGQGSHDIDSTTSLSPDANAIPREGSAAIDSGDANAPGEFPTDYYGKGRVDDPLVANTGSGSGIVDRGAMEFQDPGGTQTASLTVAGDYSTATYPVDVFFSATATYPWAVGPYLFDFGDGSAPESSTSPHVDHVYTKPPTDGGNTFTATVSQPMPSGTVKASTTVQVLRDGAPVVHVSAGPVGTNATDGRGTYITTTSAWPVTGVTVNFGDGTGAQKVYWPTGTVGAPTSTGFAYHDYSATGTYTITVTATDSHGHTSTATTTALVGSYFVPVAPKRLLDTRSGVGTYGVRGRLGPRQSLTFDVAKVYGMTSGDMTSVTFNLTATNSTTGGYVTAYDDDHARPSTSSLNFLAGQTAANQVTVPVDKNGWVTLYNPAGYVDLIADMEGYFSIYPMGTGTEGGYSAPTGPTRLLDTRSNTAAPTVGPGSVTTVHLPSTLGSSGTVLLNVTATQATTTTYITAFPATGKLPGTSLLNLGRGQTRSNLVAVAYDASHTVRLYNETGRVALIADVEGYYAGQASTGDAQYVPVPAARVLDTRNGTGAAKHQVGPGAVVRLKVTGSHGVPAWATAVAINLTGTNATRSTYLTAYPGGAVPTASNLNLLPGESRPVQAVVPIDSSGYITVHNYTGSVDVIADLEGYYALPQ